MDPPDISTLICDASQKLFLVNNAGKHRCVARGYAMCADARAPCELCNPTPRAHVMLTRLREVIHALPTDEWMDWQTCRLHKVAAERNIGTCTYGVDMEKMSMSCRHNTHESFNQDEQDEI
jgi:hypothetical protein